MPFKLGLLHTTLIQTDSCLIMLHTWTLTSGSVNSCVVCESLNASWPQTRWVHSMYFYFLWRLATLLMVSHVFLLLIKKVTDVHTCQNITKWLFSVEAVAWHFPDLPSDDLRLLCDLGHGDEGSLRVCLEVVCIIREACHSLIGDSPKIQMTGLTWWPS